MVLAKPWRKLALRSRGVVGVFVLRVCRAIDHVASSFRGLSESDATVFLILREKKEECAPQRGGRVVKSVVGA
jgi:hypothetical protein